jgi:GxxExxY protein
LPRGLHPSATRGASGPGGVSVKINDLTGLVVDVCLDIHRNLGPGLFESVYESILAFELGSHGLVVETQVPIPAIWKDMVIGKAFHADLIVEDSLIIELKSVERLAPVHKKQLLTYLRLSGLTLGLLINFGAPLLKDGIVRIVNGFIEE